MSETTARLALPLIAPGQAQKEMTHNEAIALLDLAAQASVLAIGVNAPPGTPTLGECWIVGPAPTGAWAGHAQAIAGWTMGGWRFLPPVEGCSVWVSGSGAAARYRDGGWALATSAPAIEAPGGGSVIDAEARATLGSILAALRHHGLIETDDL